MAAFGNGATLAFTWGSGTAFTCRAFDISLPEMSVAEFNDTFVGSDNQEEFIQGNLVKLSDLTANIEFDTLASINVHLGVASTALLRRGPATCTITLGKSLATSTIQSSISGTGFFTKFKLPQLQPEGRLTSSITFKFDGKTEIAVVKES